MIHIYIYMYICVYMILHLGHRQDGFTHASSMCGLNKTVFFFFPFNIQLINPFLQLFHCFIL